MRRLSFDTIIYVYVGGHSLKLEHHFDVGNISLDRQNKFVENGHFRGSFLLLENMKHFNNNITEFSSNLFKFARNLYILAVHQINEQSWQTIAAITLEKLWKSYGMSNVLLTFPCATTVEKVIKGFAICYQSILIIFRFQRALRIIFLMEKTKMNR